MSDEFCDFSKFSSQYLPRITKRTG